MEGTATFTIVASTMIIATPTLSIARPSQRRRVSARPAAGGDGVIREIPCLEKGLVEGLCYSPGMSVKAAASENASSPQDLPQETLETSRLLVEFLHAAYAVRRESEKGSDHKPLGMPRVPPDGTAGPPRHVSGHAVRAAIHVYQHRDRTVGQIAAGLGISYGWASRVVEELEAAHYVVRSRDPEDRRVVHVRIDPSALASIEGAYRWHAEAVQEALEPLSPAEQEAVRSFLRRVTGLLAGSGRERP
jgi:DNA-binding MarR family transcriptional regulator